MGKPKVDKMSRKYDVPLYCAAWAYNKGGSMKDNSQKLSKTAESVSGYVIFGGGGGSKKHGIRNRVVMAKFEKAAGEISEEVFNLNTEEDPPMHLLVHPGGDGVVVGMTKTMEHYEFKLLKKTKMLPSGRNLKALGDIGEQKSMAFSDDGSLLATGGFDGRVRIFRWPSLELANEVKDAYDGPVKDLDFSKDGKFLATTSPGSPCKVWVVGVKKGNEWASLENKTGGLMSLCRFARDGSEVLYTVLIKGGEGHIILWDTFTWQQILQKKVSKGPISAFNVSRDGLRLATGDPDGAIVVYDAHTLDRLYRLANAHVHFITAVQFSPDSKALLSVSGDSSARVIDLTKVTGRRGASLVVMLLALLMVVLAVLVQLLQEGRVQEARLRIQQMVNESLAFF